MRNHNGDNRNRSLCLTIGAGKAAAVQCGDLTVVHSMPAYRTMGRDRSLSLIYSSHTARPRPVVAAWVTVPSGTLEPDSVHTELAIGGVRRASGTYSSWPTGESRQIALAFDAYSEGLSTGLHAFTLLVRSIYASGTYDATVQDTLIVVRRDASPFGRGWHLIGVEELVLGQPGGRILWLGGDGSAKVYRNVATNTWLAAAGAFRDTLVWNGTHYVRTLRHGVQVKFDGGGRHVQTVNRVGQVTTFTWDGSGPLTTIVVPPSSASQATRTYTLGYDANEKLDRITGPANRVLDATVTSGNLTQVSGPDDTHVSFAYDPEFRMTGLETRRGYWWNWQYNDVHAWLIEDPTQCDACGFGNTRLYHWDEEGLAYGVTSGTLTPASTATAYTKIDGANTLGDPYATADTTLMWLDRWGAPTKVVNPLGPVTEVERGDPARPALVTRVRYADGRVVGAGYDARGNPLFVADSTHEGTGATVVATMSYEYDDAGSAPDSPTWIKTPVDTTSITYHPILGLPTTITAQGGHETTLGYIEAGALAGLLIDVTEWDVPVVDTTFGNPGSWEKTLQDLVTALHYDDWGNDTLVVSPKGGETTYRRDGYRRVDRVTDPSGHVTEYAYDLFNRPTAVTAYEPAARTTQYFYSPTGAIDSVIDPRGVKRYWIYDEVDRAVSMTDDQGNFEQWQIGASGLVEAFWTRDGLKIRYAYDAADQLVGIAYPARANTFPGQSWADYTIPGDSIGRGYDAVGRLTSVSYTGGSITRTYNREGTLKTERQVAGDLDFTTRYWYDAGDRRTKFFNGTDTLRYAYGPDGRLRTLTVDWQAGGWADDIFTYSWDGLGRHDTLIYENPDAEVSFGYDRDGTLRMVCSRHAANFSDADHLEHRLLYTEMAGDGMVREIEQHAGGMTSSPPCGPSQPSPDLAEVFEYDGLHQMTRGGFERYDYDASGNRIAIRASDGQLEKSFTYDGNRLDQSFAADGSLLKTFFHHADGALRYANDLWRLYYYNALGQMTGHRWEYTDFQWSGPGPDACKYDGLGRRVMACAGGHWLGFDGDNVIRMYHGFSPEASRWRYVHGPGVDDPLVGAYQVASGSYERYYYLTDGRGRQLAFTDDSGNDRMGDLAYTQNGGRQAGAIEASLGYGNSRAEAADVPELSFYRNRYYDQETGRFTTEDPIGIAGGVNLYQYAGNNPANFSDPFGLCPEPEDKDGTVCVALFIQRESVFGLKGDARGFSSTSDPSQSRVFLHIDVENQSFTATANPTCTTGGECAPALSTNQIGVAFGDDGGFTVTVNAQNSIRRPSPAINASFSFTPDGRGGFTTSGNRDAFPSAEAYLWRGGQPTTLFQRGEKRPFHLFPFMRNERWP